MGGSPMAPPTILPRVVPLQRVLKPWILKTLAVSHKEKAMQAITTWFILELPRSAWSIRMSGKRSSKLLDDLVCLSRHTP